MKRNSSVRKVAVGTTAVVAACSLVLFVGVAALGVSSPGAQLLVVGFGLVATSTTLILNVLRVHSENRGSTPPVGASSTSQLGSANFVDRDGEFGALAEAVKSSPIVVCHGAQGTGKSHFLQYVVDVVNGHRVCRPSHRQVHLEPDVALYFDLADATGWLSLETRIASSFSTGAASSTWGGFCQEVARRHPDDQVILVLDNVNADSLWPALGRAVFAYQQIRPDDRIVLGSIDRVVFDNLQVERVEIGAFEVAAIQEYAADRGRPVSSEAAVDLRESTHGLPLFLSLFFADADEQRDRRMAAAAALELRLTSEITEAERPALAYISLLALLDRRVPEHELARLPIPELELQLDRAASRSLVAVSSTGGSRSIGVHDIVRDYALRLLSDEVRSAAKVLVSRAARRDDGIGACVFALFCDPCDLGPDRLWELVGPVLRTATHERNFPLVETIHERISSSAELTSLVWADEERSDLLSFGRASQLAGLGRYRDAEAELLQSSVVGVRPGALDRLNRPQIDLYYLMADVVHLQNRYDDAAGMFRDLAGLAVAIGDPLLESRCLRSVAHIVRHQGRDLQTALNVFSDAHRAAERANDLVAWILATTGPIGIRVFWGTASIDDSEMLASIEEVVAGVEGLEGLRANIWKYQAHVAWALGEWSAAVELVEAALAESKRLNDRMLYNLYFDRADFARLRGDGRSADENYRRVLDAGLRNGDRNLVANARLGLVATDLARGRWETFATAENALAETIGARSVAVEADIHATATQATELANAIASGDQSAQPRLILF